MKGKLAVVFAVIYVGLASDSAFLMDNGITKNSTDFSPFPYLNESSDEFNSFIQTSQNKLGWLSHAARDPALDNNQKGKTRWLTNIDVPEGNYACGFNILWDDASWTKDNTGIKEIDMIWCRFDNPQITGSQLLSLKSFYNDWTKDAEDGYTRLICPQNGRISGFDFKREWITNRSDNVGMTGLAVKCLSGHWLLYDGRWGSWNDNSLHLDNNSQYICGAVVKYEPRDDPVQGDETRVNLIALQGCRI